MDHLTSSPEASATVAALYVIDGGPYFAVDGVDPWPESRDARLYDGPHSVIAHPPCARWSPMAGVVESRWGHKRGDDGGTFAAALAAVRKWGGVLEHPANSRAWAAHGLISPPSSGGWISAGDWQGWTCHVEQGNYGHRAPKATWLYAVRCDLPSLKWGASKATGRIAWFNAADRARHPESVLLRPRERMATPPAFKALLLSLARSASSVHG